MKELHLNHNNNIARVLLAFRFSSKLSINLLPNIPLLQREKGRQSSDKDKDTLHYDADSCPFHIHGLSHPRDSVDGNAHTLAYMTHYYTHA